MSKIPVCYVVIAILLFLPVAPVQGVKLVHQAEKLQVARVVPQKNNILFIQARIDLPAGEAWGQHCLAISADGEPIPPFPLNKNETLFDTRANPPSGSPICNPGGLFWLKADSDYHCHNQAQPHIYSYGSDWEQANAVELDNRFFSYAFKIDSAAASVNLALKANLPENQQQYAVDINTWELVAVSDSFFFSRSWMQAVYPWTFPSRAELEKTPEITLATKQTGIASFAIYNFKPFQGRLQFDMPGIAAESFSIYQVKNSLVEHKIKTAPELEFLNIGPVQVPELWQPLGESLQLPSGSSSFVLQVKTEQKMTPGSYQGQLRLIDSSNKESASCTVTLKILPFGLPEHDALPAAFGLYIMAAGGDQQGIWSDLREHGITQTMLSPWGCPIKISLEGEELRADFTRLDTRVAWLQQFGINRRGLFFGTSEPIISSLKKISNQEPGGAVFDRYFQEFIRLFFQHAEQQKRKTWLSLYDEANFKQEQWDKTLHLTRLAKVVPAARLWATITDLPTAAYLYDTEGLYNSQDITMTHPAALINREDDEIVEGSFTPVQKVKDLGDRFFWEYDGISSYPPGPNRYLYGNRAWQLRLQVLLGFAYWWGDMQKENYTPTRNHYVTYPFPNSVTGQRSSTPGWEAIREGIDDYRYLYLAETLLSKKYGAEEAQRRLAVYRQTPSSALKHLSLDYYDQLRSQLITIILEAR